MDISPKPGFFLDQPPVTPEPFWYTGVNMRFRLGIIETIGLFGPLRDVAGSQISLPGSEVYRTVFTTPAMDVGQILFGSADSIQLADYDPGSTSGTGTRWRVSDVTPDSLPGAVDVVPDPSPGRIEIPPVWWFADQDDLVVGGRSNVQADGVYVWDRSNASPFVPLLNSPLGAVAGGITNRILVLLGCTSLTDPDPGRSMTVRWSDRLDFEDWQPSDTNWSGELQLEGGSRIVGGGVTGFGVLAWTDKRMALLSETFDLASVFSRRYVDGGRGLLANRAWCEADGQVWWFDEHRVLNVFDGGRPRQIINPLKYATIDRATQAQAARAYLVPNPEYGEIILHYPDLDSDNPDTQLVYNYVHDAWSIWRLPRSGWCQRLGVIPSLGVDPSGLVFRHDLDTSIPDRYISGPPIDGFPGIPEAPLVDDVTPFDFAAHTNLVSSPGLRGLRGTRVFSNYVPLPSVDSEGDVFSMRLTGYGEERISSEVVSDDRSFGQDETALDFRVGGKALQLSVYGLGVRTVFRFAQFSVTDATGGVR